MFCWYTFKYIWFHFFQGENGRFDLFLEDAFGSSFGVFEASPDSALNEASVMIKVKNPMALDYEIIQKLEFFVSELHYLYIAVSYLNS